MRDNIKGGALTETSFLILLAFHSPNHGYGVMQFAERETGGRVRLGAGTLYGAIDTFLKRGWIEPCGSGEGRKKEYIVTEAGRAAVRIELHRVEEILRLASGIVGGEGL